MIRGLVAARHGLRDLVGPFFLYRVVFVLLDASTAFSLFDVSSYRPTLSDAFIVRVEDFFRCSVDILFWGKKCVINANNS